MVEIRLFWERKAETLQEEAQLIGEGAKGARMHFIEAIDPEPFD